ncbi:hypothetical protein CON07_05805 [Bacillus sp. AFS094611]|uniref:Uncharacterized protein n=1 Tax=Bacillus anthracis TaxID=1392 RepID=A0A2A7D187_BACAN|nr:hypothetical protein CON16_29345 [Bacillus anthracis]PDZ52416.1 hypothetical protein CON07_05805 [Bacillus sp. AFS094611]
MFVSLIPLFQFSIYTYQIRKTSCKMESFFMHFYTSSLLSVHNSPHNTNAYSSSVIKPILLYLQKIRRIFIKTVDMRTIMIKCE